MPDIDQLPAGQSWLVRRAQSLGYALDLTGCCFGLSFMAMQAELAGEFDIFYRRLEIINSIPLNEFSLTMDQIKENVTSITKEIRAEAEKEFEDLSPEEIIQLEKSSYTKIDELNVIMDDLIVKNIVTVENRENEFQLRKNSLLRNAYTQKKISEKFSEYPHDDQIVLGIPAFFESMMLYQNISEHSYLFKKGQVVPFENPALSMSLVTSNKLIQKGGMTKIDAGNFSGVYKKDELQSYFESLREAVRAGRKIDIENAENEIPPVTLILSCIHHTIEVSYDPLKDGWRIVNPSAMSQANELIYDASEIADKTFSSFLSKNEITTFSTTIYGVGDVNNVNALNKIVQDWKNKEDFINLHAVTAEKSNLVDSFNASWLHIAAQNGNSDTITALLAKNKNPDLLDFNHNTPLHEAIKYNQADCVSVLLKNKADPNRVDHDGDAPLVLAVMFSKAEIVKMLLASGADINIKARENNTLLHMAVVKGRYDVVDVLLNHGIDPNVKNDQGKTALDYAVKFGHDDIAKRIQENQSEKEHKATRQSQVVTSFTLFKSHDSDREIDEVVKFLKQNIDFFAAPLEDSASFRQWTQNNQDVTELQSLFGELGAAFHENDQMRFFQSLIGNDGNSQCLRSGDETKIRELLKENLNLTKVLAKNVDNPSVKKWLTDKVSLGAKP